MNFDQNDLRSTSSAFSRTLRDRVATPWATEPGPWPGSDVDQPRRASFDGLARRRNDAPPGRSAFVVPATISQVTAAIVCPDCCPTSHLEPNWQPFSLS